MAKPKQITLTETDLSAEDRETIAAFVAAKRAATQAEAALKKLKAPVLKLAKKHPALLVDGARITVGRHASWSYSAVIAGFRASLHQAETEERDDGTAKEKVTEFPVVRELSKFTGQAIAGMAGGVWQRLFGK